MAFDGGRQLEDGIAVEPVLLRERGSGGDARHDGFGGRPHAARLRDVVVRFEDEPDLAQAEGLACLAERGDDQMGLVARQRVLALAIDQHLRGAIGRVTAEREGEFVMIIEGEADRVEAGAQIGACSRHTDLDLCTDWFHDSLIQRFRPRRRGEEQTIVRSGWFRGNAAKPPPVGFADSPRQRGQATV